jgi:hypothetical protein
MTERSALCDWYRCRKPIIGDVISIVFGELAATGDWVTDCDPFNYHPDCAREMLVEAYPKAPPPAPTIDLQSRAWDIAERHLTPDQ